MIMYKNILEDKVKEGKKIGYRNFLVRLWNIVNFI